MNIEQWVEEHCQCGIDKSGKWSEELFEEFGCTCRDNFLLSIAELTDCTEE